MHDVTGIVSPLNNNTGPTEKLTFPPPTEISASSSPPHVPTPSTRETRKLTMNSTNSVVKRTKQLPTSPRPPPLIRPSSPTWHTNNHTSQSCNHLQDVHVLTATLENRMVGSDSWCNIWLIGANETSNGPVILESILTKLYTLHPSILQILPPPTQHVVNSIATAWTNK